MKHADAAFPFPGAKFPDGRHLAPHMGMTLRDYFAAKALQGILQTMASSDAHIRWKGEILDELSGAQMASVSYEMADAMLAVREETKP